MWKYIKDYSFLTTAFPPRRSQELTASEAARWLVEQCPALRTSAQDKKRGKDKKIGSANHSAILKVFWEGGIDWLILLNPLDWLLKDFWEIGATKCFRLWHSISHSSKHVDLKVRKGQKLLSSAISSKCFAHIWIKWQCNVHLTCCDNWIWNV